MAKEGQEDIRGRDFMLKGPTCYINGAGTNVWRCFINLLQQGGGKALIAHLIP